MKRTLLVYSALAMAACTSTGTGSDVVQVNSYIYMVSATRSSSVYTDLEEATKQVYSDASIYCAKKDRVAETDTLTRLDEDMGRPASATLRFRCIKPTLADSSRHN